MGSMIGHVLPGIGFLVLGLWQLFNHIKLHVQNPKTYTAQAWFPVPKVRYAEPLIIIAWSTTSIAMELFIFPKPHLLDVDFTITASHLRNFEHASISLNLLVFGVSTVLLDRIRPAPPQFLAFFTAAIAFGQELLIFHFHSTEHTGLEGHYRGLLQLIVVVSLATTVMGLGFPSSFMVSFVRSLSVVFQGVWLIVLGFMLYTPALLPEGCFLSIEDGQIVIRCAHETEHRAIGLINLEFSWYLTGTAIFGVYFYLFLAAIYGQKGDYFPLAIKKLRGAEDDTESHKMINTL